MSHAIALRFDSIAARERYRTAYGIPLQGVGRQRQTWAAPKPTSTRNPFGVLWALAFRVTVAVANAMLNAFTVANDAGTAAVIQIYTTAQPATPETAVSGQTLLGTLTMSATSFPGAASNALTASAITDDSSADATGTAAWWRMSTQVGGTAICDGSCGTATADMILNTTAITSGSAISCSSCVITLPVA
jgi:hypothetical protein